MGKILFYTVIAFVGFAPWACARPEPERPEWPERRVVAMPEPSSPAVLAADLLCVGALTLVFRRRLTGTKR
jgi:hypothetical protein